LAKAIALAVLLASMTGVSSASPLIHTLCKWDTRLDSDKLCTQAPVQAPEVDPASAMAGLTLLVAGLAVVRGRTARKSSAA